MALLAGVTVNLGGRDFVIPPLTLGALRRLTPELRTIENIGGTPTTEQLDAVVSIVHAAIERNHKEVTKEDLLEVIDMGNLRILLDAVMGVSGIRRAEPGEATPAA